MSARSSTRALCYCRDCQAYARLLGTAGVVDDAGGTEVVASLPSLVHFSEGRELLACLSMSERGPLRWYASCCRTPIGNTARNPRIAYVGLVHSCLEKDSPNLQASFGALRMAVNTASARQRVAATPMAALLGIAGLGGTLMAARLSGSYRSNPFFEPGTSVPIRAVHVVTDDERRIAYDDL